MRSVCILLFLFSFQLSYCQEDNIKQLLEQAENTIYSNPQKAIRIAQYVSKNSENTAQLVQAAYLLTRSFYMQGNYNEALKIGLKFSKIEIENQSDTQLKLNVLLSKILKELVLDELAKKYMEKAIQESRKTRNENVQIWLKGKVLQFGIGSDSQETPKQSLERLYKAKKEFKKTVSDQNSFQIGNIDLEIANIHLREFQLDSVPYYMETAYAESEKEKPGNYLEMKTLIGYGDYLFLKKQYAAAIDSLKSAQRIGEKFTNIADQITISEAIANNYLALNNLKNFNSQNEKTQFLNNEETDVENEAVNSAFNIISANQMEKVAKAKSSFLQNALFLGGVFLLVLLLWSVFAFRYRVKIKQYQNFINYFEKKNKSEFNVTIEQNSIKQSVVPKEMEETLLEKLEIFESSTDFTKQDASLSRLALQFDTNTKYLSEVINSHKQKNFNSYINELRINYIVDKLKNDAVYLQYKISYLAEDSGFSSHSVFTTVFKSVTGIPPTTFINILKDKKETSGTNKIKNGS